jgi:hypothetical protein
MIWYNHHPIVLNYFPITDNRNIKSLFSLYITLTIIVLSADISQSVARSIMVYFANSIKGIDETIYSDVCSAAILAIKNYSGSLDEADL